MEKLSGHLDVTDLRQYLVHALAVDKVTGRQDAGSGKARVQRKLRTLTDFLINIVGYACEAIVAVEFNPPL